MPIPNSHVSKRRPQRTYSGEKEGRDVLRWLNWGLFGDEGVRRVRLAVEKHLGGRSNFRREQHRVIELLRLYYQSSIECENLVRNRKRADLTANSSTKRFARKASAHGTLERRLRRY